MNYGLLTVLLALHTAGEGAVFTAAWLYINANNCNVNFDVRARNVHYGKERTHNSSWQNSYVGDACMWPSSQNEDRPLPVWFWLLIRAVFFEHVGSYNKRNAPRLLLCTLQDSNIMLSWIFKGWKKKKKEKSSFGFIYSCEWVDTLWMPWTLPSGRVIVSKELLLLFHCTTTNRKSCQAAWHCTRCLSVNSLRETLPNKAG